MANSMSSSSKRCSCFVHCGSKNQRDSEETAARTKKEIRPNLHVSRQLDAIHKHICDENMLYTEVTYPSPAM